MSRTWNNWGKGGYGKSEGKRSKPHGGEKGGSKDKDRGASLPGYDSVPSAPSTATSMVDTKKDEPLRVAMRELVTKNGLEIPDDLKEYFEPKLNEQINQDQRALNAKRKILQKIDRLKTAKEKKQQNWELFKESMREHVIKERTRFESDQQDIDQALQEAQLSLDKMISGKEDKMDETPVAEESLPEMLDMDTTRKPQEVAASSEDTAKDAQLMEQNELIHQTQMNQMYLAKQLAEMQSQLAQFASMQNPLLMATPPRSTPQRQLAGFSPEQTVKMPPKIEKPKGTENYGKSTEKNVILVEDSPYARPQIQETPEVPKLHLDALDGTTIQQALNTPVG